MFATKDIYLILKMKEEITAAVSFILKLTRQNSNLNDERLKKFENCLIEQLYKKFTNHWHPENPCLGQGYRCLRLNGTNGLEPTIAKAALDSGVKYTDLKLPLELTVWVDPEEVCCRFGEHKGSYCTIASFKEGNKNDFTDRINISELISTEKETQSEVCLQPEFAKKYESTDRKETNSSKENVAPVLNSGNSSPKIMSINPQNVMRSAMSPSQICNRSSGRIVNGCSPTFGYNQLHVSSQESFHQSNTNAVVYSQSESFPYYRSASWGISSHSPVSSQHTIYNSSPYISYSPPSSHFSSQENFHVANRMSPPLNANKMRWNSGPLLDVQGNQYLSERLGWYYPRQLARV